MKRIKYKKVRKLEPNYYEYTGIYKTEPVEMQLFIYNDSGYEEYKKISLLKIKKELDDETQTNDVKWLNVHGLHDIELIKDLGNLLSIEPFVVSDVLNVARRSKIEELDQVLFFSIKSLLPDEDEDTITIEQISFLLKDNLLVSFQERKGDYFAHIRERIKTHTGIVRKKGNDYLLYLLLEAIMENFYITIEFYEDKIEALMIESKSSDNPDVLVRIEKSRDNLNLLKRSILPLRDALYSLKSEHDETFWDGIEKDNYGYFARLHQKAMELLEQIDSDMNALDSASNFYFSTQSRKMNEVMKVLTVVSVIFMPLTFVVGIYGMNFDYMPELRQKYGYFIVMAVMFLLVVGMVAFFKKKKWF